MGGREGGRKGGRAVGRGEVEKPREGSRAREPEGGNPREGTRVREGGNPREGGREPTSLPRPTFVPNSTLRRPSLVHPTSIPRPSLAPPLPTSSIPRYMVKVPLGGEVSKRLPVIMTTIIADNFVGRSIIRKHLIHLGYDSVTRHLPLDVVHRRKLRIIVTDE